MTAYLCRLALGVVGEMPALLAEFSGAQTRGVYPESCRMAQTRPALVLNSTPRLGHAERADPAITQAMQFQNLPLVVSVHPTGGSTDMLVNQQQPSAGWFRLGAFVMTPGQNHGVEVRGALEGVTVADAIRFVSAGVSAPGINYVHTDHLGSPQKMTDANKTIVWDAVYTPFGQVHTITGTATNNQRFPGQYADAETGYSYNYFRDYDPTTGQYEWWTLEL